MPDQSKKHPSEKPSEKSARKFTGRKTGDKPANRGGKPKKAGKPKVPGLAARQAALALLSAVFDEKRLFEHAVSETGGLKPYLSLDERDRSLARAIAIVVFRHKMTIDAAIKRCLERPLAKRQKMAARILQTAAAQIAFLDIPDHAAVSVSTELATGFPETAPLKGLINAVCHRMIREKETLFARSEKGGAPKWLFNALSGAWGEDAAWAINAAHVKGAPVDLTFRANIPAALRDLKSETLPGGSLRLFETGRIEELPGFSDGYFWVQDAAAALPVSLLGDLSGQTALDLCAAPGGKTLQLIASGAKVTAVDRSEDRLARLHENLARMKLSATVTAADLDEYEPEGQFDLVLLDAPCSATGTIRRHPDLMWSKSPAGIEALVAIQSSFLKRAAAFVKPGGRLLYCTCSLLPAEGEEQAEGFLAENPSFVREAFDAKGDAALEALLTEDGALRTRPDSWDGDGFPDGGLDGFFAVVFRRKTL